MKNDQIVKKGKCIDNNWEDIGWSIPCKKVTMSPKGSQKFYHNYLVNKVLTQLENFKIQINVNFSWLRRKFMN